MSWEDPGLTRTIHSCSNKFVDQTNIRLVKGCRQSNKCYLDTADECDHGTFNLDGKLENDASKLELH